MTMASTPSVRRPSRELIAIVIVLLLYLIANALIVAARPAMMRSAVASVDSALQRDKSSLDSELMHWRDEVLDEGRWVATLTNVLLDAGSGARTATLTSQDIARLRELTITRIPGARVWVIDERGSVKASIGGDPPAARQLWLARQSLAGDSSVLGATGLRGADLRLAVASPVRNASAHDLAIVLDLSAAAELRHRLPNMTWEGHYGRAAVTFPFDDAFVSAVWSGRPDDPAIGWPRHGWSLVDSALIVVSGELPSITPRFELGIPRSAARARVDARAAWMHAIAAGVALALCVIILLVGHLARDRRLRAAESSLAESRLRTAQAETAATRAELAAIQARLNPHFLSNALHSISALVASDPSAAEEALDRIGDLFRYSLIQSEQHAVCLDDEWRFVQDYLSIEQMRLGSRLNVELSLDRAAGECDVPSFVLQPLVENAIRHGIGPRTAGGTVRVTGRRVNGRVLLEVSDDGAGARAESIEASTGTGLRTLRQRLSLDDAFRGVVDVETAPERGFRVRVTLDAHPRAAHLE
ncbi:MAG: histidine kinase [Gemmatimonadota bacterium]